MAGHATSILQKELSLLQLVPLRIRFVDTIPAISYCHVFAADPDTALLELCLSIRRKCNDFCLLCVGRDIHLSFPSRTHEASSPTHYTAAAPINVLFSLDSFIKYDRSDAHHIFFHGEIESGLRFKIRATVSS